MKALKGLKYDSATKCRSYELSKTSSLLKLILPLKHSEYILLSPKRKESGSDLSARVINHPWQ